MAFFKQNNKKKKFGKLSNISATRSPYVHKNEFNFRTGNKKNGKIRKSGKNITPYKTSGRIRIKPKSGKAKLIISLILSAGIIIFGIHTLFLSDTFAIRNFKVSEEGTYISDNERINEILKNKLNENLLLFNSSRIEKEIRDAHPEINKLKIKKKFPDTLEIEYEKFPTVANLVNIVDGIQKRFLIDSQGLLIEENTEQLDLPHIYITTENGLAVRSTLLPDPKRSKERLEYILNTINIFEEKFGINTLYAEFKPRERELHLYTEKYFYIMFDMEKSLLRQIAKLKKSLPELDIYNEPLVYIDLRISGTDTEKVIYKRK